MLVVTPPAPVDHLRAMRVTYPATEGDPAVLFDLLCADSGATNAALSVLHSCRALSARAAVLLASVRGVDVLAGSIRCPEARSEPREDVRMIAWTDPILLLFILLTAAWHGARRWWTGGRG